MTAGLETPIAAGSGPSILGIAKAIGTKIRDSAEQAKEEKEKANKEGVEVKKGSLFASALKNNFNPIKSKKAKTKWAKDFSWNQTKPKDPAQSQKPSGGRGGESKTGTKKLKNFIASGFSALLKDTTIMVGKLSSISDLTGKVYSANKQMYGSLTSINQLLQDQTDIKRDMLEQAKYARSEKSAEAVSDASGTESPIKSRRKGRGGDGGDGGEAGGDGGGGIAGNIFGALDLVDNILDIGSHLKNARFLRKMRVGAKRSTRKIGKNAKGFASKFLGKAAGKEGAKLGAKTVAKTGGKAVAKGIGKAVLKKVPLIGLAAGVGFGIERMLRGDWGGGLTEIASGAASTVPGLGTAASVALDAALMAKDMSDPASMMPPEKLAEGGIIPSGVHDNPTTGVLPPGSSVIPLKSAPAKEMAGDAQNTEEMMAMPMRAVGAAILGISDRMLKQTDSGIAGDMVRQDISRLSRDFGISSPLTTTSLGRASFGKKAFSKEGEKYFAEVMKKSFLDMGVDLSEKPKSTPATTGGGGGATPTQPTDTSSPDATTPGGSPSAPKTEPTTLQRLQENVGFVNKQVDKGFFGGGKQVISAATGTDKAGVKKVKMVDWGGQLSDKYYYDKTGRVFYIDPAQGKKSIREVNTYELKTGLGKAGKFYRNLQTGQVVVTNNPPEGYYNYEKNGVVTTRRQQIDQYGNAVRPGDPNMNPDGSANTNTKAVKVTVPLSSLQGEEKTNFGTGLYGPERDISKIKAESGISVSSRRGWRIHPVTGRKKFHQGTDISAPSGKLLYAFADGKVTARLEDSGYGKQIHWTEKTTGIGHMYAHLKDFGKNTAPGTEFKKGKVLGSVGSTGMSTGPHLHWEMATNPEDTGRNGKTLKDPLSKYSASTPFTGKPGPGDGVDSSESSDQTQDQQQQTTSTDGSQFAKFEDLQSIADKIKQFAMDVNTDKNPKPASTPSTAPASRPSPANPSSSAASTNPPQKPASPSVGMGGAKTGGSKPTLLPIMTSQQGSLNKGSSPGSVTPYAPSPVDYASTAYAINPFLLID